MTALAAAQQTSVTKAGDPSPAEPKLPVVDDKACPGPSRRTDGVPEPLTRKIKQSEEIYSSWDDKRVSVGTLKPGEDVTVWSGVNVIREPGKASVTQGGVRTLAQDGLSFSPGDLVLGYGFRGDGNMEFWARGVWFTVYYESIIAKDGRCGFSSSDKNQCDVEIVENGVNQWWVQVKTGSGRVGWVLAGKIAHDKSWSDANFVDLCTMD